MSDGAISVNWTLDMALLEDGPCAGRIMEIEATLPLHIVVRWGPRAHENTAYKKVMATDQYASRTDQGYIRYRVSENQ